MNDYRNALERLGRRASFPTDAIERLSRRRDRKRRTRRITAGVIALLVATAGSVTAFTAFGSDPRPAGVDADHFFALWPEQTLGAAAAAQRKPDEWRLDPSATASEFAKDVMQWRLVHATVCSSSPDCRGDRREVAIAGGSGDIGRQRDTELTLTLDRLVKPGEGGIWSVTQVRGSDLALRLPPGSDVRVGSFVVGDTQNDSPIAAAFVTPGRCHALTGPIPVRPLDWPAQSGFVMDIPDPGFAETCLRDPEGPASEIKPAPLLEPTRGLIIVARGATDLHGIGVALSGKPGGCTPGRSATCDPSNVSDLAVVPVRFIPQEDAPPGCETPTFRPGYLPWLDQSQAVSEPREEHNQGTVIQTWSGADTSYLVLVRHREPLHTGDSNVTTRVRGYPANLTWVGDPGVGEIALNWDEGGGSCSEYSMHLLDTRLSEQAGRDELQRIADSLPRSPRGIYPDARCEPDPTCWAVYIGWSVGGGPTGEAEGLLEAIGFRKGVEYDSRAIRCERGAAKALGAPNADVVGTALFFQSESEARRLYSAVGVVNGWIVRVTSVC